MMKKDMFDCLEETWNMDEEDIFFCKVIKNKRRSKQKILYLSGINQFGYPTWNSKLNRSYSIDLASIYYEEIKKMIKEKNIQCRVMRVPKTFCITQTQKPVRKEKWWGRIKVWFSRKVHPFTMWMLKIKKE